jgi:hypothetical protein
VELWRVLGQGHVQLWFGFRALFLVCAASTLLVTLLVGAPFGSVLHT